MRQKKTSGEDRNWSTKGHLKERGKKPYKTRGQTQWFLEQKVFDKAVKIRGHGQ
jgi:hypothetical protein